MRSTSHFVDVRFSAVSQFHCRSFSVLKRRVNRVSTFHWLATDVATLHLMIYHPWPCIQHFVLVTDVFSLATLSNNASFSKAVGIRS